MVAGYELRKLWSIQPHPSQHIPHAPRLGGFYIFISKAWIASISRSWQNQDTCKIPYNTLDSQKVPKSTVKLTLPLQEMYDTNNIKLKGEKGDTGFPKIDLFTTRVHRSRMQGGRGKQTLPSGSGLTRNKISPQCRSGLRHHTLPKTTRALEIVNRRVISRGEILNKMHMGQAIERMPS